PGGAATRAPRATPPPQRAARALPARPPGGGPRAPPPPPATTQGRRGRRRRGPGPGQLGAAAAPARASLPVPGSAAGAPARAGARAAHQAGRRALARCSEQRGSRDAEEEEQSALDRRAHGAGLVRRALLALCLVALAAPAHAAPMARSLVERSTLTLGEGIEWVVVLENAGTTVPEPQFENLDWARVQATGSSRNLSMVNGNFSSSVSYTFLLVPVRVGRHIIPSVTFQIGRTVVRSSPLTIDVVPAAPGLSSGSSGGGARLRLVITVDRNHAVVGEPIRMTVRFFQGVRLRSDPDYRAPDVPGFWTEPPAVPRSYYANDASGRWLVSETRTFLYPTVSGRLRIGSARMECELAGDEDDGGASGLSGGGTAGQTVEIQSDPITVDVAPAPAQGQPGGYQGAVGDFGLTVHPERTRVRADETMNLTLR